MAGSSRSRRRSVNVWPGFVDALASVLLIFIFMVLIFVLGQGYLTGVLAGRDKALEKLHSEISQLADTLALARKKGGEQERQIADLRVQLQVTVTERDGLALSLKGTEQRLQSADVEMQGIRTALSEMELKSQVDRETLELKLREIASIQSDLIVLRQLRDELESKVAGLATQLKGQEQQAGAERDRAKALEARLAEEGARTLLAQKEIEKRDIRLEELQGEIARRDGLLADERKSGDQRVSEITLLNNQLAALREQLANISSALELSEGKVKTQQGEIKDLGERLNLALVDKVKELNQYRSEFFGRLKEVLGGRKDIEIVGDRFRFQAELLFDSGSAEIGPAGREQLQKVAATLQEVAKGMPPDVEWVLRVDGHTDRRPINTPQFPSNWELSTARALSIVHFLVGQGIPASRLAPTGFGEFHPLDGGDGAEAHRRNRRIEFKFTEQ